VRAISELITLLGVAPNLTQKNPDFLKLFFFGDDYEGLQG
jgi:hypothetical protein